MKKNTKKKSLFAASAMLAVAVVAATGATFAWFTSTTSAKSTISMGVEQGSSIEIKTGEGSWTSSLTVTGSDWIDASTSNANLTAFYEAVTAEGSSNVTGFKTARPYSLTIEFRSTKAADIQMSGTIAANFEEHTNLLKNATIIVEDKAASSPKDKAAYRTTAETVTGTITGTNLTDNEGTYSAAAIGTTVAIVNLSDTATEGWYSGKATFYFFIEGTKTDNGDVADLAETAAITTTLTFSQATA